MCNCVTQFCSRRCREVPTTFCDDKDEGYYCESCLNAVYCYSNKTTVELASCETGTVSKTFIIILLFKVYALSIKVESFEFHLGFGHMSGFPAAFQTRFTRGKHAFKRGYIKLLVKPLGHVTRTV